MKKSLGRRIFESLDKRLRLSSLYEKHLSGYLVPENLNFWYSMGSILIVIFSLQVITGILLLVYYVPDVKKAFDSVTFISTQVPFGWLIRRVHAIGANLFVLVLFFHMLSILFMGSYKKPREIHWISGLFLFGLVLVECLSGYLLPWSQLSYWATTVATRTVESIPIIGEALLKFLRGGEKVTQFTLGRFFSAHVSFIPFAIFLLIALHVFFVRRTGISAPPTRNAKKEEEVKKMPFYPHFVLEDLKAIYIFMAVLFFFVFFYPEIAFPEDALIPANPLITPEHIKPEWYFLANYQLLKIIPNEFLGVFIQLAVVIFLMLLPFIDRSPKRHPFERPLFTLLATLGVLIYIGLVIWGYLS
jgi:ubiquinol-cytochrome c reductase cytochrome b subunit